MKNIDMLLEDNKKDFTQVMYELFGRKLWLNEVWNPSVDDIETCFKVLNKYAFDGKLVMPEIRVEKFDRAKHVNDDGENYIGRFHFDFSLGIDKVNIYIIILDPGVFTMIDYINTLCHEMIHLYDYSFHNMKAMFNDAYMKHKDKTHKAEYDTHGDVFEREMDRINNELELDVKKEESWNIGKKYKGSMPKLGKTDKEFPLKDLLLERSDEELRSLGISQDNIDAARFLKNAFYEDKYVDVTLGADGRVNVDII